jgi:hypothetical protein
MKTGDLLEELAEVTSVGVLVAMIVDADANVSDSNDIDVNVKRVIGVLWSAVVRRMGQCEAEQAVKKHFDGKLDGNHLWMILARLKRRVYCREVPAPPRDPVDPL